MSVVPAIPVPLPPHVLVVDDDQFDRARLRRLLRDTDQGVITSEASRCSAVPPLLHSRHFDLFVIDLNLPDGTGWDVYALIRSCARHADTPVLLVTGDRANTRPQVHEYPRVLAKDEFTKAHLHHALFDTPFRSKSDGDIPHKTHLLI
ncbi:response regulator [uncultured Roseobacter sp.]|uniref:response regulator n=1 Tax=uncultured Roseobacter sp. TaxID=114847 RepID=UPI00345221BC